jgi:hypothetical protein
MHNILPFVITLVLCSTRNQRCNCTPIIATVRVYRILQLAIFDSCPFTRTYIRPADAGIQDIIPSSTTLFARSTKNKNGNLIPMFPTVRF